MSQKENELTGEHSTILIASLHSDRAVQNDWLTSYYTDFRLRVLKLLGKTFQTFGTGLALSLLDNKSVPLPRSDLTQQLLDGFFLPHDIQRLEAYSKNQVEYRLILDTTTDLSRLFFSGRMADISITSFEMAILLGIGLQNKSMETLTEELNVTMTQILTHFRSCLKKLTAKCSAIMEHTVEERMARTVDLDRGEQMVATKQSLADELDEAAAVLEKKQRNELRKLKRENLSAFAIKGTEEEWAKTLQTNKSSIVSVKR